MEVDITKGLLSDGGPFYEKSNIEFICHAYATMHLNAFSRYQVKGFTYFSFS